MRQGILASLLTLALASEVMGSFDPNPANSNLSPTAPVLGHDWVDLGTDELDDELMQEAIKLSLKDLEPEIIEDRFQAAMERSDGTLRRLEALDIGMAGEHTATRPGRYLARPMGSANNNNNEPYVPTSEKGKEELSPRRSEDEDLQAALRMSMDDQLGNNSYGILEKAAAGVNFDGVMMEVYNGQSMILEPLDDKGLAKEQEEATKNRRLIDSIRILHEDETRDGERQQKKGEAEIRIAGERLRRLAEHQEVEALLKSVDQQLRSSVSSDPEVARINCELLNSALGKLTTNSYIEWLNSLPLEERMHDQTAHRMANLVKVTITQIRMILDDDGTAIPKRSAEVVQEESAYAALEQEVENLRQIYKMDKASCTEAANAGRRAGLKPGIHDFLAMAEWMYHYFLYADKNAQLQDLMQATTQQVMKDPGAKYEMLTGYLLRGLEEYSNENLEILDPQDPRHSSLLKIQEILGHLRNTHPELFRKNN